MSGLIFQGSWMMKTKNQKEGKKGGLGGLFGGGWSKRFVWVEGDRLCYGKNRGKAEKNVPRAIMIDARPLSPEQVKAVKGPQPNAGWVLVCTDRQMQLICDNSQARDQWVVEMNDFIQGGREAGSAPAAAAGDECDFDEALDDADTSTTLSQSASMRGAGSPRSPPGSPPCSPTNDNDTEVTHEDSLQDALQPSAQESEERERPMNDVDFDEELEEEAPTESAQQESVPMSPPENTEGDYEPTTGTEIQQDAGMEERFTQERETLESEEVESRAVCTDAEATFFHTLLEQCQEEQQLAERLFAEQTERELAEAVGALEQSESDDRKPIVMDEQAEYNAVAVEISSTLQGEESAAIAQQEQLLAAQRAEMVDAADSGLQTVEAAEFQERSQLLEAAAAELLVTKEEDTRKMLEEQAAQAAAEQAAQAQSRREREALQREPQPRTSTKQGQQELSPAAGEASPEPKETEHDEEYVAHQQALAQYETDQAAADEEFNQAQEEYSHLRTKMQTAKALLERGMWVHKRGSDRGNGGGGGLFRIGGGFKRKYMQFFRGSLQYAEEPNRPGKQPIPFADVVGIMVMSREECTKEKAPGKLVDCGFKIAMTDITYTFVSESVPERDRFLDALRLFITETRQPSVEPHRRIIEKPSPSPRCSVSAEKGKPQQVNQKPSGPPSQRQQQSRPMAAVATEHRAAPHDNDLMDEDLDWEEEKKSPHQPSQNSHVSPVIAHVSAPQPATDDFDEDEDDEAAEFEVLMDTVSEGAWMHKPPSSMTEGKGGLFKRASWGLGNAWKRRFVWIREGYLYYGESLNSPKVERVLLETVESVRNVPMPEVEALKGPAQYVRFGWSVTAEKSLMFACENNLMRDMFVSFMELFIKRKHDAAQRASQPVKPVASRAPPTESAPGEQSGQSLAQGGDNEQQTTVKAVASERSENNTPIVDESVQDIEVQRHMEEREATPDGNARSPERAASAAVCGALSSTAVPLATLGIFCNMITTSVRTDKETNLVGSAIHDRDGLTISRAGNCDGRVVGRSTAVFARARGLEDAPVFSVCIETDKRIITTGPVSNEPEKDAFLTTTVHDAFF